MLLASALAPNRYGRGAAIFDHRPGTSVEPNGSLQRLHTVAVADQDGTVAVVGERLEDQFVELYCRTYRASVALAYATTGSLADAEDIVQDAYAQLYRSWDRIQAPDAWLRRAIVSLSTTWVRQRVRSRSAFKREGLASSVEPFEEGVAIWQSLSCLSPRQRAAVLLRYAEDMSERDIADALRCRPGTVKSLLSRALRSLQGEFNDASQ